MHHRSLKLWSKEELSSTLFYHWTQIGPELDPDPDPGFPRKLDPFSSCTQYLHHRYATQSQVCLLVTARPLVAGLADTHRLTVTVCRTRSIVPGGKSKQVSTT